MTDTDHMIRYWGPRCPDVELTCGCCAAWSLFDSLGRPPTDDEVDVVIAEANRAQNMLEGGK